MTKSNRIDNVLIKSKLRAYLVKNNIKRASKESINEIQKRFSEELDLFCKNLKEKMDINGKRSLDSNLI